MIFINHNCPTGNQPFIKINFFTVNVMSIFNPVHITLKYFKTTLN